MIFGFEENHNTEQLCLGLQLLVQKGLEWKRTMPVFVLSADVKAAFDELSLELIVDSLLHGDVPGELVASLVEEALELKAVARLESVVTDEFPFTNSIRQGGVESTWE